MVLSLELKAEMASERSGIAVLDLLRIEDSLLDPFVLLVNNTEDFVHESETYKACFFTLTRGPEGTLPGDTTINIIDPQQSILLALESIPPIQELGSETIVRFKLVKSDNPDFTEFEEQYQLKGYEVSESGLITMTVWADPFLSVTIPAHNFTPDLFPSIFPTITGD